jgi:hypothetical protein
MHHNMKILVMISAILIMVSALAQEKLYCPDPKALQKDNGWWKVDDIWKSDSQSAGKAIKEFIGAQWIGVKIGKIICLYSEEDKYAFPVALATVRSVLIFEPTATVWMATKKGYKNCVSHNVIDCPFVQQESTEEVDLYESIKYKNPKE